jgi:hypothetical protein
MTYCVDNRICVLHYCIYLYTLGGNQTDFYTVNLFNLSLSAITCDIFDAYVFHIFHLYYISFHFNSEIQFALYSVTFKKKVTWYEVKI